MQKNDFEKNVQQRMDELQLYPSAELWPEVERRIRKEKKRRWFIFWILFPLLLAGTGTTVYLLRKTNKKNISSNQDKEPVQQTFTKENETDTFTKENKAGTVINDLPVTTIPIHDSVREYHSKPTVSLDIKQTGAGIKKDQPVKNDQPLISFENKNGGKKRNKNNPANNSETEPPLIVKKEEIIPADTIITLEEEEPIVVVAVKPRNDISKINTDSTDRSLVQVNDTKILVDSTKTESEPVIQNADSSTDANKPGPLVKKNPSKWEFGFTFNAGLSSRAGSIHFFASEKSLAFGSSGGSGPGSPTQVLIPDSRAGLFAEAGMYAKLQLKKKAAFSFGLTISSFGMKQPYGDPNGAAALASYASPYHNRYYYLQFPLQFHWQINKGNKLPLVWQNGLSPAFLFASSAVIYNEASNTYRWSKSSLNKGALFFNSGLYGRFGERSKKLFSAGLILNYQLTGLQHADQYRRNQLLSVGFQFIKPLKKN